MAGIKISALPAVPNAELTDIFAVVQGGTTSKETLQQVATLLNSSLSFLPLSGGTMTGNLILNADPTTGLQAATKQYVDTIAQGITVQGACRVGTTVALTVTYANGTAGVGATLTNAGTQAALVLDGVTLALNDRVLVKNQASTLQNGIYVVSNLGSVSTNWVMTRSSDYDLPAQINPGDLVVLTAGTTQASSSWLETATVVTVGTSAITFAQFTTALPVSVTNGGTGLTSTTLNQLLYSSANNVIAGLATANNGVLVTSAGGVPSISSTLPSGIKAPNVEVDVLYDLSTNLPLLTFLGVASAVNNFYMYNSITTNSLDLGAIGTDTNIGITITSKGTKGVQIKGIADGSNPTTGYKGEFISSQVLIASPVSFTSGVSKNLTSISLSAGDWDVWGNFGFQGATTTLLYAGISLVSATPPDTSLVTYIPGTGGGAITAPIVQQRISVSTTTTVYLVGAPTGTGSLTAYGILSARRV